MLNRMQRRARLKARVDSLFSGKTSRKNKILSKVVEKKAKQVNILIILAVEKVELLLFQPKRYRPFVDKSQRAELG